MIKCSVSRWLGCATLSALILVVGVIPAKAQMSEVVSIENLREKATELEKAGKWQAALQMWVHIHAQDRSTPSDRDHIHLCLRHYLQAQRYIDDSVRNKLLSLSTTQAISLYGEVISKLHLLYVDRSKVAPSRLYQQGVEELLSALVDPGFRELYLKEVSDAKIRSFRNELRNTWLSKEAYTIKQAQNLVLDITIKAAKELKIARPNAVIVEFIGGACNSLDEFSAYLSPAQLQPGEVSEATIVDVNSPREGLGYLRIARFAETTPQEFDSALATLRMTAGANGLRALIIDLRGNPGGQFSAALQIAERFIPEGVIATTQGQIPDANKVHQAAGGPNVSDVPVILLVDGMTASAAEALAMALRDHNRATLVGTMTFGKGSIQRVITLSTAEEIDEHGKPRSRTGGIRITLARFYAPNGQSVNGTGIAPHIVESDKARQLETAIQQASRYLSAMLMPATR